MSHPTFTAILSSCINSDTMGLRAQEQKDDAEFAAGKAFEAAVDARLREYVKSPGDMLYDMRGDHGVDQDFLERLSELLATDARLREAVRNFVRFQLDNETQLRAA